MRAVPASVVLGVAILAGCGGRSFELAPLGTGGADDGGGLAGTPGQGGSPGGAPGTGAVGGEGGDGVTGGGGGAGGAPPPDPLACLSCIGLECPEAIACVQNPVCIEGLVCGVTECLGGGDPDPIRFLGCFDGDPDAALEAFEAFSCIASTCGDVCGGLIPGF